MWCVSSEISKGFIRIPFIFQGSNSTIGLRNKLNVRYAFTLLYYDWSWCIGHSRTNKSSSSVRKAVLQEADWCHWACLSRYPDGSWQSIQPRFTKMDLSKSSFVSIWLVKILAWWLADCGCWMKQDDQLLLCTSLYKICLKTNCYIYSASSWDEVLRWGNAWRQGLVMHDGDVATLSTELTMPFCLSLRTHQRPTRIMVSQLSVRNWTSLACPKDNVCQLGRMKSRTLSTSNGAMNISAE